MAACVTPKTIPAASNIKLIGSVPFYPQDSYQCGPASLAGVLHYWGVQVTPDEIARDIFSSSAGGTLTIDMVLYAQGKGLFAAQQRGSLESLRENIGAGHPIVVLVDYGAFAFQINHFMVVIGYSEHGILANTGKDREKFIVLNDFLKAWERAGFWMLLIKKQAVQSMK